jgi:flagellar basal-body rod modification protein FlgD
MASMSGITSASNIQMDYMNLLITQLQNQNPLEPLDNNQMATQLAQFSQLQQLESMNTSFADVLSTTELSYANSLLGKEIAFMPQSETGAADITSGIVESVYNNIDGEILLGVGTHTLALKDVLSVNNGI